MKIIYCLLLYSLYSLPSYSQNTLKTYTIGDSVDVDVFNTIRSAANLRESTGELSNKLLIVDFFATNCKGCIHALPLIDSLREKHKEVMQVVAITYENGQKLKTFQTQSPIGKYLKLPFIANDSLIAKHFPHYNRSHIIWIYKGIVRAITFSDYVNKENVAKILSGETLHLPVKRDVTGFDYEQNLLILNHSNIPAFSMPKRAYYTAVTSYLNNLEPSYSMVIDSVHHIAHYCMINWTIPELYFRVAGIYTFPKSQMKLNISDTSKYFYEKSLGYQELWDSANRYCYDAYLPTSMDEETMKRKMYQDLDDYFGIAGRIERQTLECLVLDKDFSPKPEKPQHQTTATAGTINIPTVEDLLGMLNQQYISTPVQCESAILREGPLQLTSVHNLNLLEEDLKKYGITIRKEKREIDMFLLKEKSGGIQATP